MRTAGKDWSGDAATGRALKVRGALHILRHTFCSHLAMRGVPPLSLKELAGHRTLRTTMRYMHLGKGEKHRAIQMLEEGRGDSPAWRHSGDEKEPGFANLNAMKPARFERREDGRHETRVISRQTPRP